MIFVVYILGFILGMFCTYRLQNKLKISENKELAFLIIPYFVIGIISIFYPTLDELRLTYVAFMSGYIIVSKRFAIFGKHDKHKNT